MDSSYYYPTVLQAIAGNNYTIYVYMNDDAIRRFDVLPLIESNGLFKKLRDPALFRSSLTVINDTAAWDLSGNRDPETCIDIDPFLLYNSPVVSEDEVAGAL